MSGTVAVPVVCSINKAEAITLKDFMALSSTDRKSKIFG